MRVRLLALLAVAATLLTPTAHAARAALTLEAPAETLALSHGSLTRTSLVVTLRMSGFACSEDETFPVRLEVTPGAVNAALENQTLAFHVPAGAYLVDGFEAEAPVLLTLSPGQAVGPAKVRVSAHLAHAPEACVSPGPFPETTAEATLRVLVPERPAPQETEPAAPADEASAQGTQETPLDTTQEPEESTAASNETQQGGAPPTTPYRDPSMQFPQGGGWIGDYDARTSGTADILHGTPGLPLAGLALGVLAAALVARRKA